MPDELDLMQLAQTGELLTTVDAVAYHAASIVLAWPSSGVPTIYCRHADWPMSPAARLAAKDREIAELAALAEASAGEVVRLASRIAQLESQLAVVPKETPVKNQERMFQQQAAALDTDGVTCPDCGKADLKNERALRMHQQRAHQGMVAGKPAPAQFVEPLGWHCAAKGCQGSHARDLHDDRFCTLHAHRQLTNGTKTTA
jgi:hypothetical protein